jgi:hypothetical protein
MQPERRVLRLETCCYNKSHPGPKLATSLRLDEHKSIIVCFQSLPDFPKYCLHIIHFQPCVLLGSRLSSSHIIVVSQVPSCNHFSLSVLVYRWFRSSALPGVVNFWVISFSPRTWLHASFLLYWSIKCHLRSCRCSIRFGSSCLDGLCRLDHETWESFSPSRAFDEAVR